MHGKKKQTQTQRTGQDMVSFREDLIECLENKYHTSFEDADPTEMYKAVATVVNQQLMEKRWEFNKKSQAQLARRKDARRSTTSAWNS